MGTNAIAPIFWWITNDTRPGPGWRTTCQEMCLARLGALTTPLRPVARLRHETVTCIE